MNNRYILRVLAPLLLVMTLVSACSGAGAPDNRGGNGPSAQTGIEGETKAGGTVTYGYPSPFKGLFEPAFYEGEDDLRVLEFITEPLLTVKDDLTTAPGIATWQESADHKTFTFKIKHGVRWQNGDELTVEDWKFALEVIAHPDYTGPRYYSVEMIEGAEAYRAGKAKRISGIRIIDPYTMEIKVTTARVNTIDNLWAYPMNERYFAGVAVKDMPSSDQVRKAPIGIGPFQVKNIQPGEFVEMSRFDNYYKGKPLLDGVLYKVFDDKMIASLFEQGAIDIEQAPRDAYESLNKLDNVKLMQSPDLSYEYIGFKFGHWDAKAQRIVMDNPKFADKRLRQAMYYALDRQGIIDGFSYGLGKLAETPISSESWAKIPEEQINRYPYDPGKAKELLDEAGYKDKDGDGLREDPKGAKFVIHFDSMVGGVNDEPRTEAMLQNWREVGLDVRLNGGALKEMNTFYTMVEEDDPSVELFNGVWGLSNDPDPSGLWRENDLWNYPRWSSRENERLIREGVSVKAYDRDYRKQVYYDWQKLINEEVPMMIFAERETIIAANKRLQGVKVNAYTHIIDPYKWWIKDGE
ncbi:peptide/nickel transport system substrate-binding protein [Paenibacillus forsythiae]|uniref:Peptide/nickel transport system substrate-binding protein n=1 Tax=Paenibacillus forsythiae TaxID=365616 RepID=A0ABU3H345_9BACL|nr:oligopeptide ABC transporter substrate-binding protein [Paenibacillus forsythiae]MDT3425245.1 peptide/nickel transport system substrate-binding protein [Paenibacillus forsythiae]